MRLQLLVFYVVCFTEKSKEENVRFGLKIEPKTRVCNWQEVNEVGEIKEIQFEYDVYFPNKDLFPELSDLLRVSIRRHGTEIFTETSRSGQFLEIRPPVGHFELCFENEDEHEKKVFVKIWMLDAAGLEAEKILANTSGTDIRNLGKLAVPIVELNQSLNAVERSLKNARKTQMFFRDFEVQDMIQMEKNAADVVFWSAFTTASIIFFAVGRSFLIRALFEADSNVGRLLRKGGKND